MPNAPKSHGTKPTEARKQYDQRRGTAHERGYTKQWLNQSNNDRRQQMAETGDPKCRYCQINNSKLMDHAIPPTRLGASESTAYKQQFAKSEYWIPCCRDCNTKKGDLMPHELQRKYPEMYLRLVAVLAERGVKLN